MEESEKKVDEEWKKKIREEKVHEKDKKTEVKTESPRLAKVDFSVFVSNLAIQALASMGLVEDKEGMIEKDPEQARYIIDTLDMLKLKTKGNLTPNEERVLDNLLHELRMGFVAISKKQQ
jgi:anaerobic C4-dicarboxylate transporter